MSAVVLCGAGGALAVAGMGLGTRRRPVLAAAVLAAAVALLSTSGASSRETLGVLLAAAAVGVTLGLVTDRRVAE